MATAAQKQELEQKLARLIANKFRGDFHKAFEHYGANGCLRKPGLLNLLSDANVGNWLTRGAWADGILHELDRDQDGAITQADLGAIAPGQKR